MDEKNRERSWRSLAQISAFALFYFTQYKRPTIWLFSFLVKAKLNKKILLDYYYQKQAGNMHVNALEAIQSIGLSV